MSEMSDEPENTQTDLPTCQRCGAPSLDRLCGVCDMTTWRVVATNIQTGEQRVISGCHSEDEAKAIVRMTVMRRGVNEEFFKAEPDTPPAEPNEPPTLTYGDEDKDWPSHE